MNPWHGVLAPVGIPQAIVDRLSSEIQALLRLVDFEAKLRDRGVVRVGSTTAEFSKTLREETAMYRKLVSDAGIKGE